VSTNDPRHLAEHYAARPSDVFHSGATGRDLAVELTRHLLPWAQDRVAAGMRKRSGA